ncbi:hypothetical protein D9756_003982 [Leucocoprinus leucothites]|uniref:Uncharacterized protein n=1 Tax=Leucocoprinus leucothites TaxID=201217 RepID=A0A8H5G0W4_9AGAR|nr:hypothetical protein D9756_003982 [Leucoagaricus leucothites]
MSLATASSSANPASSFSALWAHLQPAIDYVMTSTSEDEEPPKVDYTLYANIHSSLYNYFAKCCNEVGFAAPDGSLPGHEVYDKLDEYFQNTCKEILLEGPGDGPELVAYVVSAFQRYNKRASAVERLTSYINRHYVRRALDEEKGWINLSDALEIARQNRTSPDSTSGSDQRTIAQIKFDSKISELKKWGYKEGELKESAPAAEARAEAASSLDRIVPVLSLARRRFRIEVLEPLLVYPKYNNKARLKNRVKPPTGPPPYRSKGRLARGVQNYHDSYPISDSRQVLSMLDLTLSTTGIRPETHLRKRLHHLLTAPEK